MDCTEAVVMSKTLSLLDAAWASARDFANAGRRADAHAILRSLMGRPDLPAQCAIRAHRLAATLDLQVDRYRSARKHLVAAAKLDPRDAETHYQLGVAFGDDPYGCDERAARRFRRAAKLAPDNGEYWAALGRAAIRINRDRSGLKAIRRAVSLAPTDPSVLTVVVEALRDAGRVRFAWKVVCRARFLAPTNLELRKLWERVKFDLACSRQKNPHAVAARVLPFVCVVGRGGESRRIRRDAGSNTGPHVGRFRVRG
jgi:Flp pilus assembly protein TadD